MSHSVYVVLGTIGTQSRARVLIALNVLIDRLRKTRLLSWIAIAQMGRRAGYAFVRRAPALDADYLNDNSVFHLHVATDAGIVSALNETPHGVRDVVIYMETPLVGECGNLRAPIEQLRRSGVEVYLIVEGMDCEHVSGVLGVDLAYILNVHVRQKNSLRFPGFWGAVRAKLWGTVEDPVACAFDVVSAIIMADHPAVVITDPDRCRAMGVRSGWRGAVVNDVAAAARQADHVADMVRSLRDHPARHAGA